MSQRAGWYDDPENPENLRYYDGVLWTANTTPKAPTPRVPEPRSPEPTPAQAPGAWTPTGERPAGGPERFRQQPTVPPTPPAYGQQQQWGGPGYSYGAPPSYPQAAYAMPLGLKTTSDGVPLASYGQRVGAWVIDYVIQLILWTAAFFLGPWYAPVESAFVRFFQQIEQASATSGAAPDPTPLVLATQGNLLPYYAVQAAITVVYQVAFLTSVGATPGKLIVGIQVRLRARPGRLGLGPALLRQVVYVVTNVMAVIPFVSLLTYPVKLVDLLWPLWDDKRQALHDKIAGTNVVVKPRAR